MDTRTGAGNDCNIDIIYNQQKPLCSKVGSAPFFGGDGSGAGKGRDCREVEELCTKDENFKLNFDTVDGEVKSPDFLSVLVFLYTDILSFARLDASTYTNFLALPYILS